MQTTKTKHEFDASRLSIFVLLFAALSLFMHLLLHNYNKFKENITQTTNYTSAYKSIVSKAQKQITPDTEIDKTDQVKNSIEQNRTILPLKSLELTPNKKFQVKKLGNITLVSMGDGSTLFEALIESGTDSTKAHLIATAIDKKYRLSKIRSGDTLQIVYPSKENKKRNDIKIIISQKTEILVRGDERRYEVTVHKFDTRPKKDIAQEKQEKVKISQNPIQKFRFNSSDIATNYSNAKANVRKDVLNIIHLLRNEKDFKGNNLNLEVICEQLNNKTYNLLYAEIQSNLSKVRVYKYRDNLGITHYIKQDGVILNKKNSTSGGMKKFGISYPVQNPVLGSGFGMRLHPILGKKRMHNGIDFTARRGTPIHAPADGVITDMKISKGFGRHIRMRHNNSYTTLYAHLDRFADKVVGRKVYKGEVIGYVGRSGLASGEHLHFEVHENGVPVNPSRLISNNSYQQQINQLTKSQMARFKQHQVSIEKRIIGF